MLEAPAANRFQAFVANIVKRRWPQFVAIEGENIVGWCDAIPGDANTGSAHVARLGMGVVREHRRRGIGRRLVEATLAQARRIGLEKIELGVYASNHAAIALYRKLGFAEEGRKKRSRLVDGVYEDVVLMAIDLRNARRGPDPRGARAATQSEPAGRRSGCSCQPSRPVSPVRSGCACR